MSISNEAIEAAARAIFEQSYSRQQWHESAGYAKANFKRYARAALTAAAPLIEADAVRAELMEAASLLEPFSGIGLANGATRNDVANWLRARAVRLEKGQS